MVLKGARPVVEAVYIFAQPLSNLIIIIVVELLDSCMRGVDFSSCIANVSTHVQYTHMLYRPVFSCPLVSSPVIIYSSFSSGPKRRLNTIQKQRKINSGASVIWNFSDGTCFTQVGCLSLFQFSSWPRRLVVDYLLSFSGLVTAVTTVFEPHFRVALVAPRKHSFLEEAEAHVLGIHGSRPLIQ